MEEFILAEMVGDVVMTSVGMFECYLGSKRLEALLFIPTDR